MISPTGLTISFGGTRGRSDDSRPVIARIAGFADGSDQLLNHELVVPAGQSKEQRLPQGLYNVQLTLPSGRIIQRNVKIDVDSNETYRFFEDFGSGSGFSLQESVGRDDNAILADAAESSGNTSEADYREAQAKAASIPTDRQLRRSRDTGPRSFSSQRSIQPNPPRVAQLSQGAGALDLASQEAGAAIRWSDVDPADHQGNSAIWRLRGDTNGVPTRLTRRWARVQLATGGVEIVSLPLPWFCVSRDEYLPADILVDPSRTGGAATTVAIRDEQLAGLLAFLDRGQASAAGPLLAELEQANIIEQTISDKMSNPLAACAAAYVGLAVYPPSEREQWDHWLGNCMRRFPDVPDAAIVHARRLILRPTGSEDNGVAASALRAACAAGVPFFSAGVFLLREMLTLLSADYADLRPLVERANILASRVDASQAFTVARYASSGKEAQ
ncbi:hypothetical protein U1839_26400 [Sphingomonas sp. RT2P30]